ncbi:hypothetical protein AcW1_000068 [Taiwanofungus camphoratus]|nr:hypothetical protein AcW2_001440 [Antrodia cinnamomea]KAI0960796.1 hypothetical protein AcV7_000083 [Antrodia cinnamomea]KAI0962793.1 hypothetical protein AcW1_000068 [Antrodia cinnamomea]
MTQGQADGQKDQRRLKPTAPSERRPRYPHRGPECTVYAAQLPFLAKVYLLRVSTPQYSALYHTILAYQVKAEFSAQCLLPGAAGTLSCPALVDPTSNEPYDVEQIRSHARP